MNNQWKKDAIKEISNCTEISERLASEAFHTSLHHIEKHIGGLAKRRNILDSKLIDLVDKLAGEYPDDIDLALPWVKTIHTMFTEVKALRYSEGAKTKSARDYHVGESNYSEKKIQPWDIWGEYALNPWDADICKRTVRIKVIPGISAKDSRIQDYEKIKHICDERIEQIKNGDQYYKNFKIPEWAESGEK